MKYKITGHVNTREVFMNGLQISPYSSLKVINHSPDGFNWGYGGSGPAQLALAILMHGCENEGIAIDHAVRSYQKFKEDHIVHLNIDQDFEIEVYLEEYLK